jgi:hypothetical protein
LQLLQPGPYDTTPNPTQQQFVMQHAGNCFFEFLPVLQQQQQQEQQHPQQRQEQQQQQQPQQQRALLLDDLEVGCQYEVLITNFAGLTRWVGLGGGCTAYERR